MPSTPSSWRASRTASSLAVWMMASSFVIDTWRGSARDSWPGRQGGPRNRRLSHPCLHRPQSNCTDYPAEIETIYRIHQEVLWRELRGLCVGQGRLGPVSREQLGIRVVTEYPIDRKGILYAYLFIGLNKYSRNKYSR